MYVLIVVSLFGVARYGMNLIVVSHRNVEANGAVARENGMWVSAAVLPQKRGTTDAQRLSEPEAVIPCAQAYSVPIRHCTLSDTRLHGL